jgi:hypothetical protein
MSRFGSDDHYTVVLSELISGLAARRLPAP